MTARARSSEFESDGVATIGTAAGVVSFVDRSQAKPVAGGEFTGHRCRDLDRRISIHEAGHAVVGHLLNMAPLGATINFCNGHHGRVWFDQEDHADVAGEAAGLCDALAHLMPKLGESRDAVAVDLLHLADIVVMSLAGREAEKLVFGTAMVGTSHDLDEARDITALIVRSPSSVAAYLVFAEHEAAGLLAEHRDALRAVADALLRHRTLDGRQIGDLINGGNRL
jgi:hypothetical protein